MDIMQIHLPIGFTQRIAGTFGKAGQDWLTDIPLLLVETARRWSLELAPPFHPLSYNYVDPAIGPNDEPLVLKAGVPNPEYTFETDALHGFLCRPVVLTRPD